MVHVHYQQALLNAQKHGGYDSYLELLAVIRREKLREPAIVAEYGKILLTQYKWRLGNNVWTIYEQVFIASLDLHDHVLGVMCLNALRTKFPSSSRVSRLEGMEFEQMGEYSKALEIYDELLKENPANALLLKRKIAVLKAQKKTQEAIIALNEFLRNFQIDRAAWLELAELYLSISAYRYAAYCYEELVVQDPMDSLLHARLADVYCTIGGLENLRTARKHYCHSIDLNKNRNMGAILALLTCTNAIACHRQSKNETEDLELNSRVAEFAKSLIEKQYTAQSKPELAQIATETLGLY